MTGELDVIPAATEAGAVAELARNAATAGQAIQVVGNAASWHHPHITVSPDGHPNVLDLRAWAPPSHVKHTEAFREAASFVAYVARMQTPHMLLRANADTSTVWAVFDFHADAAAPGRCVNRAEYTLARSYAWGEWEAMSGELVPQDRFAEFLTERRAEVMDPDAAAMIELAQTFQAHTEVTFRSRVSLASGAVQFMYDENSTGHGTVGAGTIPVPEVLHLRMPITMGGDPVELTARLRWRTPREGLRLGYTIERAAEVWHGAFSTACESIAAQTGAPVLR